MANELPNRLSPSRSADFEQCPRLFHFKTILERPVFSSQATAAGRLTHLVLDELFELKNQDRSPVEAEKLIEPSWEVLYNPLKSRQAEVGSPLESQIRNRKGAWAEEILEGTPEATRAAFDVRDMEILAPPNSLAMHQILKDTRRFVKSYFKHEQPELVDPLGREVHLNCEVEGVQIHGIIDRLDSTPSGDLIVVDYKTGKTPRADQLDDRFSALKLYALMVAQNYERAPVELQLIYVRANVGNGIKRLPVTKQLLETAGKDIVELRRKMEGAIENDHWPATPGPLCPYCAFRNECPEGRAFVPDQQWTRARQTSTAIRPVPRSTMPGRPTSSKTSATAHRRPVIHEETSVNRPTKSRGAGRSKRPSNTGFWVAGIVTGLYLTGHFQNLLIGVGAATAIIYAGSKVREHL